jgi:hypothetical protein
MPKRLSLPILVFFTLLWLAPVRAQSSWQVWLYDPADARMTLVNETGFVQDVVLPVEAGFDLLPQRVAVAHGGSLTAYTIANSRDFRTLLFVANPDGAFTSASLPADSPAATILADSLQYVANEFVFDESNASLAIGYSLVNGGWEISVRATGNLLELQRLRSNDPLVTVLGLSSQQGITPIVQRFQERTVIFTLIQTGTEGASQYSSYRWNLDTNAVTADIAYLTPDSDTLAATGEVVMSLHDERLANTRDNFIFFQANSLHVYDPALNARYPFYNQPDVTLFRPRFIQGGERVLAGASDAAGTSTTWQVIERSGAPVGNVPIAAEVSSVAGVPDGFIYTSASVTPGATALVYVNSRNGLNSGFPVWTSAPGATPQIMWAGGTGFTEQTVLPGWAQLAAPVSGTGNALGGLALDAGGGPVIVAPGELPTSAPASGGILAIGGQATINTTEGDTLNVRGGPGTSFQIVARLPDGTRVTLLEGPRAGDGYTWWRIRGPNGVEGWVVESVDDRGTRLQTLIP